MKEFIITNVSIIDSHNNLNRVKKEIRVCNGKIAEISENIKKDNLEVIDGNNSFLSAGMIDVHVHNRLRNQPGRKNESTLESIDMIGVDRGVTTVVECG